MFENPSSILITGAPSGIGKALAEHYAADGITLFLGGRNSARLTEIANRCSSLGAEVHTWVGDVTDEAGMKDWIVRCDKTCR